MVLAYYVREHWSTRMVNYSGVVTWALGVKSRTVLRVWPQGKRRKGRSFRYHIICFLTYFLSILCILKM